jgi:NADH:ubiquinone oxidoreductase subunit H
MFYFLSLFGIYFRIKVIETLITIICVLLSIAFFTIAERKLMASIQRRKGPNVVGY